MRPNNIPTIYFGDLPVLLAPAPDVSRGNPQTGIERTPGALPNKTVHCQQKRECLTIRLPTGLVAVVTIVGLTGCTSIRTTSPTRSAQEVLLISTAADRAAEALAAQVPANLTGYIDASGFVAQDQAYGLAAITDALLRHGVRIVSDRTHADAIILPRAGVLSTDERQTFFGIPALPTPIALGAVSLPSLSFYQESQAKGVAKFAASIYDPKTGKLIVSTDPAYGFSSEDDGVVFFLFTWRKNDMGLDFAKNPPQVTAKQDSDRSR